MIAFRAVLAMFLLWHPGFSEHTALVVLLCSFAVHTLGVLVGLAATKGAKHAAIVGVITLPVHFLLWVQPWFSDHTFLVANLVLALVVVVLDPIATALEKQSKRTAFARL